MGALTVEVQNKILQKIAKKNAFFLFFIFSGTQQAGVYCSCFYEVRFSASHCLRVSSIHLHKCVQMKMNLRMQ